MILIDAHGWKVEYNSNSEEYTVTDPMKHKCITKILRVINPLHFVIGHPKLPDEHIFPGRSVPCLGKAWRGCLQKLIFMLPIKVNRTGFPANKIMKSGTRRKGKALDG